MEIVARAYRSEGSEMFDSFDVIRENPHVIHLAGLSDESRNEGGRGKNKGGSVIKKLK